VSTGVLPRAPPPNPQLRRAGCVYGYMLRTAIALSLCLVAAATSGCVANTVECSGPCTEANHTWSPTEIAADLASNPFPDAATRRDHLYKIHCQITHAGKRATCAGVRPIGPHPHRRITIQLLLHANGSWDLICWPNPSSLCEPVQIKEQRAHPLTPD
jgi:hypothetical protein